MQAAREWTTAQQSAAATQDAETEAAEPAAAVWAMMSEFVRGFDPIPELRRALALGRGSGRVRTLLGLADGPLSVARLAEASGADAPYTTLIVNELEALGLVSRTSDERDRRRKLVALTSNGQEAVRTAQSIIARPPVALRGLPKEDLAELRRILERLGAAGTAADTGSEPRGVSGPTDVSGP